MYILVYFRSLATRIKDLLNAQKTTDDEIDNDPADNEEVLVITDYKYQIVNSCLPRNGDYHIENCMLYEEYLNSETFLENTSMNRKIFLFRMNKLLEVFLF